jgi:HD-GYP domain-containing protein (c-di-GMP phosphodiesterase class II)
MYDYALIDCRQKIKELAIEVKKVGGGFLALFHVLPHNKYKVDAMPRYGTSKTYQSFVDALARTMQTRDPETASHEQFVSGLAGRIADQMGLSSFTCEGIRVASLIHDAGKISVPADILSKKQSLTEDEWSLVREHPRMGYEIIRHIAFPWPVATAVLQHHERMDGSGYPYALTAESIIIEARVLAVADTFVAMRARRAYRPPVDVEWAIAELYAGRGKIYDADVVDACAKCIREYE